MSIMAPGTAPDARLACSFTSLPLCCLPLLCSGALLLPPRGCVSSTGRCYNTKIRGEVQIILHKQTILRFRFVQVSLARFTQQTTDWQSKGCPDPSAVPFVAVAPCGCTRKWLTFPARIARTQVAGVGCALRSRCGRFFHPSHRCRWSFDLTGASCPD